MGDLSKARADARIRKALGTDRAYVQKHNGSAALWLRNRDRALCKDHEGPLLAATAPTYRDLVRQAEAGILFENARDALASIRGDRPPPLEETRMPVERHKLKRMSGVKYGCKELGTTSIEDCRDPTEADRRYEEYLRSEGHDVVSVVDGTATVRSGPPSDVGRIMDDLLEELSLETVLGHLASAVGRRGDRARELDPELGKRWARARAALRETLAELPDLEG